MSDAMYAALSGAVAQGRALEIVADNLANVSTTGFKGSHITFQSTLNAAEVGEQPYPASAHVDAGQVHTDFSQGPIRSTGNPLDTAFAGPGFFVVDTPAGERFTRNGNFSVSPNGTLQDNNGHGVVGAHGGVIRLPPTAAGAGVHIEQNGGVVVGHVIVDSLRMVAPNANTMLREGNGLWSSTAKPELIMGNLQTASLEGSNVNAVHAMTEMINIQRAYESYHRAMETTRSMEKKVTTDLG